MTDMDKLTVELIEDEEAGGFTARLPDVPAYGEGETEQEAIDDLRAALKGYVETYGLDDLRSHIRPPVLREVQLDLGGLAHA